MNDENNPNDGNVRLICSVETTLRKKKERLHIWKCTSRESLEMQASNAIKSICSLCPLHLIFRKEILLSSTPVYS